MENNEDADFGIKSPIQAFLDFYKTTPKQIKMLDLLIALSFVLSMLQLTYYILGGRNPFEAFVAGLFCTLGIMVLTVSLRLQLGGGNAYLKRGYTMGAKKAIFEYIIPCFAMFLGALNYAR